MNFLKKLTLFSLTVGILLIILSLVKPAIFNYKEVIFLWVVFTGLAWVSLYLTRRTLSQNPKKFPVMFMSASMGKLFIILIITTIFIFTFPMRAKGFLITEAIFYFAYSVFEVIEQLRLTKRPK